MRTELKKRDQSRDVFRAIFERFGKKSAFRGPDLVTVLLRDVTDLQGNIVADHVWMNHTKEFASLKLQPGDIVQFRARVKGYIKGYRGMRYDVWDRPIERDYKLSRPTKVCIVRPVQDKPGE